MIFRENDVSTSINFIKYGSVEIFIERNSSFSLSCLGKHFSFAILQPHSCFGELGFFTKKPRQSSAKALEFTYLFAIEKIEFKKIIETSHRDFEMFQFI